MINLQHNNGKLLYSGRHKTIAAAVRAARDKHVALMNVNLAYADLQHVDFSGEDLSYANFKHARLASANFTKSILLYADCQFVTAAAARFDDADMRHVQMDNADLCGASLANAQCNYGRFRGTNLYHCNLRGAVFQYADTYGAKSALATRHLDTFTDAQYAAYKDAMFGLLTELPELAAPLLAYLQRIYAGLARKEAFPCELSVDTIMAGLLERTPRSAVVWEDLQLRSGTRFIAFRQWLLQLVASPAVRNHDEMRYDAVRHMLWWLEQWLDSARIVTNTVSPVLPAIAQSHARSLRGTTATREAE